MTLTPDVPPVYPQGMRKGFDQGVSLDGEVSYPHGQERRRQYAAKRRAARTARQRAADTAREHLRYLARKQARQGGTA